MSVLTVLLLALVACAAASDVVVLDDSNFDKIVDGSKNVFVEFYAPWCGHCKNLAPEYEIVATAFKTSKDVVVASVDADKFKDLGQRFGVRGFPTLKFFKKGGDLQSPEAYEGGRTADAIVDFINSKAGTRAFVKKAPSNVVVLDDSNFNKIVDGSKNVLVEFYAPWCGHCKTLAPKYETLGNIYSTEKDVVVAKVDADKHKELGGRFGVTGFPTLKFFPKGGDVSKPEDYNGGREVNDFVSFLNGKAGTKRLASGGLEKTAGRIAEIDALVKDLVSGAKKDIVAEIEALRSKVSAAEKEFVSHYKLFAQNFAKSGKEFVQKQKTRLAGLSQSGSVTPDKKDEFQIKANILDAFDA